MYCIFLCSFLLRHLIRTFSSLNATGSQLLYFRAVFPYKFLSMGEFSSKEFGTPGLLMWEDRLQLLEGDGVTGQTFDNFLLILFAFDFLAPFNNSTRKVIYYFHDRRKTSYFCVWPEINLQDKNLYLSVNRNSSTYHHLLGTDIYIESEASALLNHRQIQSLCICSQL